MRITFRKLSLGLLTVFLVYGIGLVAWNVLVQAKTISGYKQGMDISSQIGQGGDLLPGKLQKTVGYFSGMSVAYLVGEEGNVDPSLIFDDVQRIGHMAAILEHDLPGFLNESTNRSDGLDVFLEELVTQRNIAIARQDIVSSQIVVLNNAHTAIQDQGAVLKTQMLNSIDQKLSFASEDSLQKLLLLKNKEGELLTKITALQRISDRYKLALGLLTNKIEFVSANRDALIKGVKVVDIKDPQVKLIYTREEWQSGTR